MKKLGIIAGITILFLLAVVLLKGEKKEKEKEETKTEQQPVQVIAVRVDGTKAPGYFLSHNTVKKGSKVRLNFVTDDEQGCARAVNIPSKNLSQVLPESGMTPIEFIADKAGEIAILCDMGMYYVALNVVA